MTRVVALPHLQTVGVETSGWLVAVRGDTTPVPSLLDGWDYQTPLAFESQVSLDPDIVREECGLAPDAQISAVAMWWASSTTRRAVGAAVPIHQAGTHNIRFDVDPGLVGGRLTLHRQLLLDAPGAPPQSPFAATRCGSILWDEPSRQRTTLILEGDAARFPTEVIDFGVGPVAEPNAAWWLHTDFSDLDVSPLGALRLYVNGKHPRMEPLLSGRRDAAATTAESVMAWDVARTMIHAALDSNDFVERWGTFHPGTVGEALETLIRQIWPAQNGRSLRSDRAIDRGLFEARLQARLDILGTQR